MNDFFDATKAPKAKIAAHERGRLAEALGVTLTALPDAVYPVRPKPHKGEYAKTPDGQTEFEPNMPAGTPRLGFRLRYRVWSFEAEGGGYVWLTKAQKVGA